MAGPKLEGGGMMQSRWRSFFSELGKRVSALKSTLPQGWEGLVRAHILVFLSSSYDVCNSWDTP